MPLLAPTTPPRPPPRPRHFRPPLLRPRHDRPPPPSNPRPAIATCSIGEPGPPRCADTPLPLSVRRADTRLRPSWPTSGLATRSARPSSISSPSGATPSVCDDRVRLCFTWSARCCACFLPIYGIYGRLVAFLYGPPATHLLPGNILLYMQLSQVATTNAYCSSLLVRRPSR